MAAQFNLPTGKFQHAFNWAVKNGKVSFMDGQKGLEDFSKYTVIGYSGSIKSIKVIF